GDDRVLDRDRVREMLGANLRALRCAQGGGAIGIGRRADEEERMAAGALIVTDLDFEPGRRDRRLQAACILLLRKGAELHAETAGAVALAAGAGLFCCTSAATGAGSAACNSGCAAGEAGAVSAMVTGCGSADAACAAGSGAKG